MHFRPHHGLRVKRRRMLEPIQHRIGRGVPRHGAQQAHQRSGGSRGGQLPAGFITHGHAPLAQHGAHPARQNPILRHQGHRTATGRQMRQHTGSRTLRLVLGIRSGVQRHITGNTRHTLRVDRLR